MRWAKSEKSGPHQLRTVLVFPMIYRVSTIRSVAGFRNHPPYHGNVWGWFLIILTLIKHGLGNIQYSSCLNDLVDMALSESRLSTKWPSKIMRKISKNHEMLASWWKWEWTMKIEALFKPQKKSPWCSLEPRRTLHWVNDKIVIKILSETSPPTNIKRAPKMPCLGCFEKRGCDDSHNYQPCLLRSQFSLHEIASSYIVVPNNSSPISETFRKMMFKNYSAWHLFLAF